MNTLLHKRLKGLEDSLARIVAAPNFPIYNPTNPPQDGVLAQIFIGTDNSINWYDGTTWRTYPGIAITAGNSPQDPIEGQVAITTDHSLCWYVNAAWYGAKGYVVTGDVPQDAIEGQIAIGTNTIVWYSDGDWYALPELL